MTPASRSSNSSATSTSELESARAKDPAENPVGVPGFSGDRGRPAGLEDVPKVVVVIFGAMLNHDGISFVVGVGR